MNFFGVLNPILFDFYLNNRQEVDRLSICDCKVCFDISHPNQYPNKKNRITNMNTNPAYIRAFLFKTISSSICSPLVHTSR